MPQKNIAVSVAVAYGTTIPFTTTTAAIAGIPTILNATYGQYADNSTAIVTYTLLPTSAAPTALPIPDVTPAHLTYTMVTADYTFPGNTFTDLSSAAVLNFLAYKFPNAVPYQISILTYNYFETGYAGTSGTITTDTFIFVGGAWVKTYAVSPAQYAMVGRGLTNTFGSADLVNISTYFNTILKSDPSVGVAAKAGDVKYVSYKYNNGTMQEVLPMLFDGTNWACKLTAPFIKTNGNWVLNPAINYTLATADYTALANSTVGTAAERAGLSFNDFDYKIWTVDADINAGIAFILASKFPTAKVNQEIDVTFKTFNPSGTAVKAFVFDGTNFVFTP